MKIELEDLSFKYLKPDVYKKITQLINKKKLNEMNTYKTLFE